MNIARSITLAIVFAFFSVSAAAQDPQVVPHPTIKGEVGQSHPGGIYQLRFTPDEKYLVSCGPAPKNKGYVAFWNVADGKLVTGMDVPFGPVFGLAISPDGKNLLLGCGPKVRQIPEAEAMVIPLPVK